MGLFLQARRPDEDAVGAIMKKERPEARAVKNDFLQLTLGKEILFIIIFLIATYYIIWLSFSSNPNITPQLIFLNSLIWLIVVFLCYSLSAFIVWMYRKVVK